MRKLTLSEYNSIPKDYYHNNDGRYQIVQQFQRLARIGCHQIQKHIHCDNGLTEKIQQYKLEGSEEDERK